MDLTNALRAAVAAGDFSAVPFAEEVVLRSSSSRGIVRRDGRAAVVAHLAAPGPGAVVDWDARAWAPGAAISFEWVGERGGHDRRRWYVRTRGSEISALWSYEAAPRRAGAEPVPVPPGVLSVLAAEPVGALEHGGNSGAALQRVDVDGEHLIVKRASPGGDWLARATADRGRTGRLWRAGVFRDLATVVETGIVEVLRDEGAWWIVMQDLAEHLVGDGRLSRGESRVVLQAAAAIHARFRGRPPEAAATLEARLGISSPAVAAAERESSDLLPKQFELAWEAFADAVPADVAAAVLSLVERPGALADALAAHAPLTLLHGDLRDDNLGFDNERVVLLDWDLATAGTPSVEFAWYLLHDAWRIDATRDEILTDYREVEEELDEHELDLGLVSGLVQYGWVLGHSARIHPDPAETTWARAELEWWVPRVRAALERTGVPGRAGGLSRSSR